jgi:hypothetical protein
MRDFADTRRDWRQVETTRLNRWAEIAGTDMGIKRLGESGGRDDDGEDRGNGKLAHDILVCGTPKRKLENGHQRVELSHQSPR